MYKHTKRLFRAGIMAIAIFVTGFMGTMYLTKAESTTAPSASHTDARLNTLSQIVRDNFGLSGELICYVSSTKNFKFYYPIEWQDRLSFEETDSALSINSKNMEYCANAQKYEPGYWRHACYLLAKVFYNYSDVDTCYADSQNPEKAVRSDDLLFKRTPQKENFYSVQAEQDTYVVFIEDDENKPDRWLELTDYPGYDAAVFSEQAKQCQEVIQNRELIIYGLQTDIELPTNNKQAITSEFSSPNAAHEEYKKIIQEYLHALFVGYDSVSANPDNYPNVTAWSILDHEIPYYSFYDIDRNGTDELLIAVSSTGREKKFLINVFTFDGESVQRPFDKGMYQDTILRIYENGILNIEYFVDVGEEPGNLYYRLKEDGFTLDLLDIEGTDSSEVQNFNWQNIREIQQAP